MTKLVRNQEAFAKWHYKNDLTHVCFFSRATFEWLSDQWQADLEFFGIAMPCCFTNGFHQQYNSYFHNHQTISMPQQADIAIIGAGAAGLAAGIFAAKTNPSIRIILLDGAKTIGAKILVSGGGRCNVTNQRVTASDFHGNRKVIDRILRRFDEAGNGANGLTL